DVPEQACSVVLDHEHDRPLIDSEVIRRDPPTRRTILDNKRLIERRFEPVFPLLSQVHLTKIRYAGYNDFRSKRQRSNDNPRRDSTVVGAEWSTSSDIVKKVAFDPVDGTLCPARSVAGCESPAVFAIANEIHGIPDRVFLPHKR